MICKICNNEVRNTHALRFHLNNHGLTLQQYYDIFYVKNGEDSCIICNRKSRFCNFTKGYSKFCSQQCYAAYMKTQEWDEKQKNTKSTRYGDPNFCNASQAKNTRLSKNAGKYESEESLNKAKETCKKHFGVEHPAQADSIKDKMRYTCVTRYNETHYSKTKDYKIKFKETCKNHFGVEHPLQNADIHKKYEETCLEKYGCINAAASESVKTKIKETWIEKYNVDHPMKVDYIYRKSKKKIKYNDITFDSKPEVELYKFLTDKQIDFEYQPNVSFTYEYNGAQHKYYPDFRIENKYIELKGSHFFSENGKMINPYDRSKDDLYEAKHQCMISNNIIIIPADNNIAEVICDIFGLHS